MGFRFSLATVLRLREIAEEREERLLGQILHQLAQARQTLIDLQAQHARLIQKRETELQRQMSAAELHISYGQMRAVEEQLKHGRDHLEKLETLRDQQMKIYEAAHRNRELLAGMRDEQREHYQYEQTRQEQNTMDDNFMSRRSLR